MTTKTYRNVLLLGTLGGAVAAWIGKGVKKLWDNREQPAAPATPPDARKKTNDRSQEIPFYMRRPHANGGNGHQNYGRPSPVPVRHSASPGYYHRGDR